MRKWVGVFLLLVSSVYAEDKFIFPISNDVDWTITSEMGMRDLSAIIEGGSADDIHEGIDIVADGERVEILATADGVVIEYYPAPNGYFRGHYGLGGYIVIQHDSGDITKYAHMRDTFVLEGMEVEQGDVIGIMGNTGIWSSGVHLHYVHLVNPLNSALYMRRE